MKFLADVNVPQSVIKSLKKNNHDVLDFKRFKLDFKDTQLIKLAQKEERIIITLDKDFIALTQYPKYRVGLIVLRLGVQTPERITKKLNELLSNQDKNIIRNSLTILREEKAESLSY